MHECEAIDTPKYGNVILFLLVGTRRACRAGEKRHLSVYTRDMFLRRFIGLKRQKFSCSLLARHHFTRQLACEPQTGSLTYFSVPTEMEQKTTSSLKGVSNSMILE